MSHPVPRSPCPSPTPLFQQLYLAVAHWERVLAESPDSHVEREQIVRDLERLPLAGPGHSLFDVVRPLDVHHRGVEAEDSDDEQDDDEDEDYSDDDPVDQSTTASPMRRSRTKTNGFVSGRLPKQQLCAMPSNSSTDTKDR